MPILPGYAKKWVAVCAMGFAAGTAHAVDLGTYQGCAASDADFTLDTIALTSSMANNGPLKLAFDKREDGSADVYFIRRMGEVVKYDGITKSLTQIGKINAAIVNEDGLTGIALDPAFKTNRNLYLFYSFAGGTESTFRLSRFTLDSAGLINMTSEKVLLRIPSVRGRWHTGGAMEFDAHGDLWISVGDNQETEKGPSNTASLLGGTLRIRPDSSARGYSIPAGNFGAFMAAKFRAAGSMALAAEYEDTVKVKPELYVKGTRNAYTLNLDPVRRWLMNGDVGPDQGQISEEYNLVKEPAFLGWPYFAGNHTLGDFQTSTGVGVWPYSNAPKVPQGIRKDAPLNNSNSGGVIQLPPAVEPTHRRTQACAMSGPLFRYDGSITSPRNFPPQFNRKWLISGCDNPYGFHLVTLSDAGIMQGTPLKIFAQFRVTTLVDLKQGPDGALYFANFDGRTVLRISYKGTCKDPNLRPEVLITSRQSLVKPEANRTMRWLNQGLELVSEGPHQVVIADLQGREVMRLSGQGPKTYSLENLPTKGLYTVKVETRAGALTQTLSRY